VRGALFVVEVVATVQKHLAQRHELDELPCSITQAP
jgi:hypothetical protein